MADEIKAGDVVQLKSGGPLMTVEQVSTNDSSIPNASCIWFNGPTKMTGDFPLPTIQQRRGLD